MAKYGVHIGYIQSKTNVMAAVLVRVSNMECNKGKQNTLYRPALLNWKKYDSVQTKLFTQNPPKICCALWLITAVCPQDLKEYWNFREGHLQRTPPRNPL